MPHELNFLPAALALQESPISPLPRVSMWVLISFSVLAASWATFGHIDIVTTAQGKVVPNGRVKTIQPFEIASIRRILVTDGQQVNAGDVLVELDETTAKADESRLREQRDALRLSIIRSQSFLDNINSKTRLHHQSNTDIPKAQQDASNRLLQGMIDDYHAKQNQIDTEISRKKSEYQSVSEVVKKLEKTLPIAQQRAGDFKILLEKNFISRHAYLEREQARIELESDLATQRNRLREISASLSESKAQHLALKAETTRITLDELNTAEQNLTQINQEIVKAKSRRQLTRLTSPIEGKVQQLSIHTSGGVVTPAQPLMVIVPQDNDLEIEAMIENKDIGFVKPGQEVEIKVQAFQYTKYGTVPGSIKSISLDAIQDEKLGLVYSARIQPKRSYILIEGSPVNLTPGMQTSVEIKTGQRRIIEYFLSPLIQHTTESLRER